MDYIPQDDPYSPSGFNRRFLTQPFGNGASDPFAPPPGTNQFQGGQVTGPTAQQAAIGTQGLQQPQQPPQQKSTGLANALGAIGQARTGGSGGGGSVLGDVSSLISILGAVGAFA